MIYKYGVAYQQCIITEQWGETSTISKFSFVRGHWLVSHRGKRLVSHAALIHHSHTGYTHIPNNYRRLLNNCPWNPQRVNFKNTTSISTESKSWRVPRLLQLHGCFWYFANLFCANCYWFMLVIFRNCTSAFHLCPILSCSMSRP